MTNKPLVFLGIFFLLIGAVKLVLAVLVKNKK